MDLSFIADTSVTHVCRPAIGANPNPRWLVVISGRGFAHAKGSRTGKVPDGWYGEDDGPGENEEDEKIQGRRIPRVQGVGIGKGNFLLER
ncbi:MAG: hypothetical protein AAGJ32_04070 [Pseudomonadota bacterium]